MNFNIYLIFDKRGYFLDSEFLNSESLNVVDNISNQFNH